MGMTWQSSGGMFARSTRFSRHVLLTQMAALTSLSVSESTLLMWMEPASAKPNSEWSV